MSSEQINMKKVVMGALLCALGSTQLYTSAPVYGGVSTQTYAPTSLPSSVTIGGTSLTNNNQQVLGLNVNPNLGLNLSQTISPVVNQQTGGILTNGLIGGNNIPVSVSNVQGVVSGLPLGAVSGVTNVGSVVGGVVNTVGNVVDTVSHVGDNLGNVGYVVGSVANPATVGNVVSTATNLGGTYANVGNLGGVTNVGNVVGTVGGVVGTVNNVVGSLPVVGDLGNAGYVVGNVANLGTVANIGNVVGTVSGIANNVVNVAPIGNVANLGNIANVGGVLNGLTVLSNNVVVDSLGHPIGVLSGQTNGGLINVGDVNVSSNGNVNTGSAIGSNLRVQGG